MGCDIHSYAEVRNKETGKWEQAFNFTTLSDFDKKYLNREKGDSPFDWRGYGMYGFLADVRNYSHIDPIVEPRGIPDDVSETIMSEYDYWYHDAHTPSHIYLRELVEFDYTQKFWNRRIRKQTGPNSWTGRGLADEGEGEVLPIDEFLSEMFFQHIEDLKTLGDLDDVRVVFWFDN
jgi:hypothetical protein